MGLKDTASLALIPAAYKTSKIYSALPTDGDGDFTFTRSGNATRVNKAGLVETMGTNIGRLNYDLTNGTPASCPSLLLEPSRTNNASRSETPQDGSWADPLNEWTLLTETTTSPRGDQTRVFDLEDSTGTLIRCQDFSVAAGTYTISFYIKDIGGNLTGGIVDLGDVGSGDTTPSLSTVGSEWVRVYRTITITSTKDFLDIQLTFTGSTNKVGIWGLQLEAGSLLTSYIQTTGTAAVTRATDSCEIASGIENLIGQTEGTLFLDFEYLYETTSSSSTDANRDIFVLGTASDVSEGISIDNYRSQFRVFVQGSGMSTQFIGNSTIGAAQPNTRYKLAVKYKTGDCKAYLNGTLLGSGTGTVSFAADLDGIFFSYNSGSRPFKNQKKVYQLMVFNEALSDSELQTLTS
jgi:hypothetical protein